MPPTPPDSDTSYALDDDFGLDGLNLQIAEADAEDEAELEAYLSPGGDPDEDTDGVREADADEGFSEIEAELADFQ